VEPEHALALRELLGGSDWVGRTTAFARALRAARHRPGGLLVVGPPDDEPWHLTAHLTDAARWADDPTLVPTLVRHAVPVGAPAHLAVDLTRLRAVGRGETILVVAPDEPAEQLLTRLADARRAGAALFGLDRGSASELAGLVGERLTVAAAGSGCPDALVPDGLLIPDDLDSAFGTAQHLVTAAVGERPRSGRAWRDRLGRFLDLVSGPSARA
jgi:hypothetical protein